jgi:RNA-directed DNA polymerase
MSAQHSTAQHVSMVNLSTAYRTVCVTRLERSANDPIWGVRFNWASKSQSLLFDINQCKYMLSPLSVYRIKGETYKCWTAKDLIVLKALSIYIQKHYGDVLGDSTHLKDKGGIHEALKQVESKKSSYPHILKSDVYHYYDSINHQVLFHLCDQYFNDPIINHFIKQYAERVEVRDGLYAHKTIGIPRGCPLSPIVAAIYLKPLDDEMKKMNVPTIRFMDDWISFAKSKQQLRKIIKRTHRVLNKLKVTMHPDKTFIGKTRQGFSFLGIQFSQSKKIVAKSTLNNHLLKLAQLYEQGTTEKRIGVYLKKWRQWCQSIYQAVGSKESPPQGNKILSIILFLTTIQDDRSDRYEQESQVWMEKELTV